MKSEKEEKDGSLADEELRPPPALLSVEILLLIKDAQQQHGLRQGDYQRYRGYCSRRIRRLRKVLKVSKGDPCHYRYRDVISSHLSKPEARLLCIPLMMAERAWAHGMQLRQESKSDPRKRIHLIGRLRKACSYGLTLLALCQGGACDTHSQLEAEAYNAWLHGILQFELQLWKQAIGNLQKAQVVYKKLASTLPEKDQNLYRHKVEELKQSLRYCGYNIGDKMAQGDLLDMHGQGLVKNLGMLMLQAKEARSGRHEIEWCGRKVFVHQKKVCLFLISLIDLEQSIAKAQTIQTKIEILENVLMDCKDVISALKDNMKNDPKQKQTGNNAPLTENQYLLSYLTYLHLKKTIERNCLLVQLVEEARLNNTTLDGKKVKPQDLARLYEIILQNFAELQQMPCFENNPKYQEEFTTELTAYKAFHCYNIAQVLISLHRWSEALVVFDRSTQYAEESISLKLKNNILLAKLELLKKEIEKCKLRVHADSVLEDEDSEEDIPYGKTSKNRKPFAERLDEYSEVPQALTKSPNIYKLPPPMEAAPCKPFFFDLASNFVKFSSLDHMTRADDKSSKILTGLVKGLLGWG